ncbi:MAG TPA: hypothetical protein VMF03_07060 [Steroidobacteraceae bacterium]|nr:hypothetical protein [Steroidobacteraceae bacterium]
MKAVMRLIVTYFSCTPAARAFSAAGVLLIVASWVAMRLAPPTFAIGVALMVGVAALYVGSSMMPLMLGRLARAQTFRTVPFGRIKLLVSGLLTVLIVALPAPGVAVYGLLMLPDPHGPPPTPAQLAMFHSGLVQTFWTTASTCILIAGWLYVVLWFITSQRSLAGYLKALGVIVIVLFLPTRHLSSPQAQVAWDVMLCGATLAVFSILFLVWPQLRPLVRRIRGITAGGERSPAARLGGRETDLLLGTANPWLLALGQLVPVLLASRIGFYSPAVWLYYLTLFSTVAGAIAGQAAERSRGLWLRGDWSTSQLFVRVEKSFWRHNVRVLGVLLVLLLAIGTYEKLPVMLLAAGLPLIVLGTVLSTYLGLMVTRGLRAPESLLAIAVMLTLMAVAVLAARPGGDLFLVGALEGALALLAVVLRLAARGRWARIDWTQCRTDRALRSRAPA